HTGLGRAHRQTHRCALYIRSHQALAEVQVRGRAGTGDRRLVGSRRVAGGDRSAAARLLRRVWGVGVRGQGRHRIHRGSPAGVAPHALRAGDQPERLYPRQATQARRALGAPREGGRGGVHRVDRGEYAAPSAVPGAAQRQERPRRGAGDAMNAVYSIAGVQVSRPAKVLFEGDGKEITKADVAQYYAEVAEVMLPHLRGRPITMQRFPDGIASQGFYEKKVPEHFPGSVATTTVATADARQAAEAQ